MIDDNLIRIISFNLKRDGFAFHRSHKWGARRALAAQFIRESGATIIGVQELLPSMRDDVSELLDVDYSILGFGRFSGRKPNNDEHSDIIIKNGEASVNLIKTFWLSKSPERLSRAYYAIFPRICTVAEVYVRRLGRSIRVFNTHLDHICGVARVLGVRVILDYMEKFNAENPMPTILMGDLNCKPKSRPIQLLHNHMLDFPDVHLTDVYSKFSPEGINNTFHNFSGKIKRGACPIDYIFVSDDFEIVDSQIITDPVNGAYPSDHYPLIATLRLRDSAERAACPAY